VVLGLDATTLAGPAAAAPAPANGWDATSLQTSLLTSVSEGAAARLLVAPDLCKHFLHEAPAGLQSLAELQELAALRAAQLFGGVAGWVVVADWRLDATCVCAALPQPLLLGLREAADARQITLGVESAVLVALERLLRGSARTGFLGWASPQHAVLVGLQGGAVRSLHCTRRADVQDGLALRAQLLRDAARDAAREGLPFEDTGAALALAWPGPGAMPPDAFDAADALPPSRAGDSEAAWSQRLGGLT
jgi:hypothetical protein